MTSTKSLTARIAAVVSVAASMTLLVGPGVVTTASAQPMSAVSAGWGASRTPWSIAAPRAVRTAAPLAATSAAVAGDFSSIFADQLPELANSGWSACAAPITWSVDTRGLTEAKASAEIANIQWAFDQWASASGLTFQFSGAAVLTYNDAAFTVTPADGSATSSRHIYLAFIADQDSARLGGGTVGLGSPGLVMPDSKEITGGAAVFRTDFVTTAMPTAAKSLYLHELGHVLGLAHANESANVMYPVVTDHVELGIGDITGVRTMTKACA